ncbi:sedoheptulose-1,7-bisphosphatase [Hypoxylon argillaceum]|nr:sedoheptulose-1,7-bisphosphatase [Hypoxylon argillaceum]
MSSQTSAALLAESLRRATGPTHPSLTTSVIPALLRGIAQTAAALRGAHSVETAGSANAFGDAQLNVDVLAEQYFRDATASCAAIVAASSEEDPVEVPAGDTAESKEGGDGDVYAVAFDPLDGSSIIAPNWAVGSIIGVWAGRTALNQDPARQIAAVLGVYGPRTTALVAVRVPGREGAAVCVEVGIDTNTSHTSTSPSTSNIAPKIEIVRSDVRLADLESAKTRYFAPANLRAASEDARYMALVTAYIAERYTLRYSGGLVPDVAHALAKGHGVYVSPVTGGSKAKLRRAFELLPVALVVECAGGAAVDPVDGSRVLGRELGGLGETGGLVCGTGWEVERVVGALVGERV